MQSMSVEIESDFVKDNDEVTGEFEPFSESDNDVEQQLGDGTTAKDGSTRERKKRRLEQSPISQDVVTQEFIKSLHTKVNTEIDHLSAKMSEEIENTISNLSDKLTDKLLSSIDSMIEEKLKPLNERCDKLEEFKEQATTNNTKLTTEIQELKSQIQENKSKINIQAKTIERLEFHSKKLNIIFDGVPERQGENCKSIVEGLIRRDLGLTMANPVDIAHRLEKRNPDQPAGLIARFKTVAEKSRVIQNSAPLRDKGIYIKPDLPIAMTQRRSFLAKSLGGAKEEDKDAKLVKDKLLYKGNMYTIDNIHEAGIQERGHTITTDTHVRFYGYPSKFSNFHRTRIQMNGRVFSSAEQAFQFFKADRRGDRDTAGRILRESHPVVIKRLARHLAPRNEQEERTDLDIMYAVVKNKFQQNTVLREALLQTTNLDIVECNPYDKFYSCGLGLQHPTHDNPNPTYPGRNHLGKIMQTIRRELRD